MPKLQLKTEPIEAIQWTGKNLKAVEKLFPESFRAINNRLYVEKDAIGLREIQEGDYLFADGTVATANAVKTNYKEVK